MAKPERAIPYNLQPHDRDWSFDIETALRAIVSVRADVPDDAFSAEALGTERAGSGVVIEGGLVVTMAYLIMEAETIWLTTADGKAVPGYALAVDFETGFGLVQPLGELGVAPIAFGDAAKMELEAPALLAASGGRTRTIETRLVGRQEFAGYWEYLIEDAMFTAPAHPFWGGAGLIDANGKLVGIGSLILQQGDGHGHRVDMNMVVPISLLIPRLAQLRRYGRVDQAPRPWLGLFAMESDDQVVAGGIADGGPADKAGIRPGDRLVAVEGEEITDLAALWRRVWQVGPAGARVRMTIGREEETLHMLVKSVDRMSMLRGPKIH